MSTVPANYHGLTTMEAKTLLKKYGYNERPRAKKTGGLKRALRIITEPMILLILGAAVVYILLHDWVEGLIIFLSLGPILAIEFVQEARTDKAIAELDKYLSEHARVYRDGQIIDLEIKYLVPGDLVHLTAGDKIPADGILYNYTGLMVDESILTGESVAVVKKPVLAETPPQDDNRLFQGTLVAQGEGLLFITATGAGTKYGKLGKLLSDIESQETPLQNKVRRLVRGVAVVAAAAALIIAGIVGWREGALNGILAGLTIAMALVPEEFPIVFSVFLVLGVLRLARHKALVRRAVMVETLGSATVIATDKTGTLTEGRMALQKIYADGEIFLAEQGKALKSAKLENLIQSALLALEKIAIDPIEIETQKFAKRLGMGVEKFFSDHILVRDSSFSAQTKMVHHLWQNKETRACAQYTVGAPENVINGSVQSDREKQKFLEINNEWAKEGYRVIAVGKKAAGCDDEIALSGWEVLGLIAMSDPPRAEVPEAVAACQQAGIRIIMITGDNKLTAHTIAEHIGLKHNEEIVGGENISGLSDEQMRALVTTHDIFARIQPEQKYRIVKALQENGEVVAMTGDGVNDAPALKKAEIGIAMGARGTEVARAAAGIVLLDDNFASIAGAVREGRRVYDNLRTAFSFLFSFHLPIIGLALIPLFFNQPIIFAPIHIIFLELFCDPASVLGFERERARRGLMSEPPRPVSEPLINPLLWSKTIWQGVVILAVCLSFYFYGWRLGGEQLGRTLAFASLVVAQIALIVLTREWSQVKANKLLLAIAGATLLALAAFLTVDVLRVFFHFSVLSWSQAVLIVVAPFLTMSFLGLVFSKKKII